MNKQRGSGVVGRTVAFAAATVAIGAGAVYANQAPTTAPADYPNRAELLVEKHGCWTGSAPADVDHPQHAIVTKPGELTRRVGSQAALEHVFEGAHPDWTVHAFCR